MRCQTKEAFVQAQRIVSYRRSAEDRQKIDASDYEPYMNESKHLTNRRLSGRHEEGAQNWQNTEINGRPPGMRM